MREILSLVSLHKTPQLPAEPRGPPREPLGVKRPKPKTPQNPCNPDAGFRVQGLGFAGFATLNSEPQRPKIREIPESPKLSLGDGMITEERLEEILSHPKAFCVLMAV